MRSSGASSRPPSCPFAAEREHSSVSTQGVGGGIARPLAPPSRPSVEWLPVRISAALAGALIALSLAAPARAAEHANWSAGPVARGTGYWSGHSARVREVQLALRAAGLRAGRA